MRDRKNRGDGRGIVTTAHLNISHILADKMACIHPYSNRLGEGDE